MLKRISAVLMGAGLILAVSLSNCSNSQWMAESQKKDQGVAMLKISVLPNSPFTKIAKTAVITISGPDMLKMTKSLSLTDTSVEGLVKSIPAGDNRLFEVSVFDAQEVLQYQGSASANVLADSTVMVSISLYRVVGNALINGTIIDTGTGVITPDITTGLLAYYPFNGNTKDESGNGLNAISSGTSMTTDRFGGYYRACYFNGNATLSTTVSELLSLSKVTLCAWMKSGGSGSYLPRIISVAIPNEAQCYYGLLFGNGVYAHAPEVSKNLIFMTGTASDMMTYSLFYSKGSVDTLTWRHVAVSFDSRRLKFYIDGALDKDTVVNTSIEQFTSSAVLTIGCSPGPDRFVGSLDEVRIYNRALTDSEIKTLYSLQN
jgi:hypothetical protein